MLIGETPRIFISSIIFLGPRLSENQLLRQARRCFTGFCRSDYLFRDMLAVIKRDGKGFTAYAFPKPGTIEAFPKISYSVAYQPWNWILTTGLYVDDIDAAFRSTLYQSLGILLILGCVLSAVVALLNRGILRSMGGDPSYAAEIANQIASNDLTAVVKTAPSDRSSLLFSMKRMQEQLTQTIGAITVSAESMASATHQIAAGNQDLSQRTEEQAASLEETAASMEQLTSTHLLAPRDPFLRGGKERRDSCAQRSISGALKRCLVGV